MDRGEAGRQLNTWAEIGEYLGVTDRTARTYAQKHGLPVRRLPGSKARVCALTDEIDAWWAKSHVVTRQITRGPIALAASLLLGLLAITGVIIGVRPGPASDVVIQGKNIIVVNAKGRELWRHSFQTTLAEEIYGPATKPRHIWLGDLNGDRRQDLLFVEIPRNFVEAGSTLHRFSNGNHTAWRFTPGRAITDGSGERMVPPFFISRVLVLPRPSPADSRIIVSGNHYAGAPNQIAVLDIDGKALAEYWHPGHLVNLAQADLDRDGVPELLAGGVHNGFHQAVLVVLRPWRMSGVSTPTEMPDPRFRLLDMPEAREPAVVWFPRSCISKNKPYTRVHEIRVLNDRIVVITAEGTNESDVGIIWELDHHLRVLSATATGDEMRILHQQMERSGQVDHPYTAEIDRLRSKLEVRADWQ